jgi:asparagine synthase (glutamine-hydrolysing)
MRRLSIIDVNGSEQPLYNHDGTLALVFNGEIYNYRELRTHLIEQGYDFRTDGDGETILHLYEAYGVKLFEHLRGMYAFALWDARQERLLVAVDHIGMKPLYLLEQDGLLAFASEVKAFFTDEQRMLARLNLNALDTYLSFGFQVGQATSFEGVQRLPAGHYLVAEKGAYHLHPIGNSVLPLIPPRRTRLGGTNTPRLSRVGNGCTCVVMYRSDCF